MISGREMVQQRSAENTPTQLTDAAKFQPAFPPHHTSPTTPGHLTPFPTGKTAVPKTRSSPSPTSFPYLCLPRTPPARGGLAACPSSLGFGAWDYSACQSH